MATSDHDVYVSGVLSQLQSRVMEYYAFVQRQTGHVQARAQLFDNMSRLLQLEIAVVQFVRLIEGAVFFRDLPPWGIGEILQHIVEEFFSPGDYIVRCGEIGNEMYFLTQGVVEVVLKFPETGEEQLLATKKRGEYFGEIALVRKNSVRTAYVRARYFCVTAKLSSSVLHDVIRKRYPRKKTVCYHHEA